MGVPVRQSLSLRAGDAPPQRVPRRRPHPTNPLPLPSASPSPPPRLAPLAQAAQAFQAFMDPTKGGAVGDLAGKGGTVLFSAAKGESHGAKEGLKVLYRRIRGQFEVSGARGRGQAAGRRGRAGARRPPRTARPGGGGPRGPRQPDRSPPPTTPSPAAQAHGS